MESLKNEFKLVDWYTGVLDHMISTVTVAEMVGQ